MKLTRRIKIKIQPRKRMTFVQLCQRMRSELGHPSKTEMRAIVDWINRAQANLFNRSLPSSSPPELLLK